MTLQVLDGARMLLVARVRVCNQFSHVTASTVLTNVNQQLMHTRARSNAVVDSWIDI